MRWAGFLLDVLAYTIIISVLAVQTCAITNHSVRLNDLERKEALRGP